MADCLVQIEDGEITGTEGGRGIGDQVLVFGCCHLKAPFEEELFGLLL